MTSVSSRRGRQASSFWRHAALVHLAARRLAGDEDRGARIELQDRPRTERQCLGADPARPHIVEQPARERARDARAHAVHPETGAAGMIGSESPAVGRL
jgi:hypothetical protein